jgi:uncharacterized protein
MTAIQHRGLGVCVVHFLGPRAGFLAPHAEEWRSAKSWPPTKAADSSHRRPNDGTSEPYQADFTVGSGSQTRGEYIAGIEATSYYADWTERERLLPGFTSEPLDQPFEIAGHPVVSLWLASSEPLPRSCLSLRGRGQRHVALLHRGHPVRPPSRRGTGARQPRHDLAVADVRARRCQVDAKPMPAGEPQLLRFALLPTA